MTSLMQFFGCSLNKIAKLRLHEKENSMRRSAFDLVVSELIASLLPSDEAETLIQARQKIVSIDDSQSDLMCTYIWHPLVTKNPC